MATKNFIDNTALLLKKSLDLRAQNQKIIASNIANAQTPGYAAKRLEFETSLRQAVDSKGQGLAITNPRHITANGGTIGSVQGNITEIRGANNFGDGNNVAVDQDMVLLAKNQLMFEASVQLLSKKMGIIKYVVQGN